MGSFRKRQAGKALWGGLPVLAFWKLDLKIKEIV